MPSQDEFKEEEKLPEKLWDVRIRCSHGFIIWYGVLSYGPYDMAF